MAADCPPTNHRADIARASGHARSRVLMWHFPIARTCDSYASCHRYLAAREYRRLAIAIFRWSFANPMTRLKVSIWIDHFHALFKKAIIDQGLPDLSWSGFILGE